MNELKTFENERFGNVRVTMIDNEPWFVATDVCKALDVKNNRDALTRIDDDEKGVAFNRHPWRRTGSCCCQRIWPLFPCVWQS